jgi:hypothetical protein
MSLPSMLRPREFVALGSLAMATSPTEVQINTTRRRKFQRRHQPLIEASRSMMENPEPEVSEEDDDDDELEVSGGGV